MTLPSKPSVMRRGMASRHYVGVEVEAPDLARKHRLKVLYDNDEPALTRCLQDHSAPGPKQITPALSPNKGQIRLQMMDCSLISEGRG